MTQGAWILIGLNVGLFILGVVGCFYGHEVHFLLDAGLGMLLASGAWGFAQ